MQWTDPTHTLIWKRNLDNTFSTLSCGVKGQFSCNFNRVDTEIVFTWNSVLTAVFDQWRKEQERGFGANPQQWAKNMPHTNNQHHLSCEWDSSLDSKIGDVTKLILSTCMSDYILPHHPNLRIWWLILFPKRQVFCRLILESKCHLMFNPHSSCTRAHTQIHTSQPHTYINMFVYMQTNTNTHTHLLTHPHIYVCMHICTCMHTNTNIHTHMYTHTHAHVSSS